MDANPAVDWWKVKAKDVYRQTIFSELYGFHLFKEEPIDLSRDYYEFKSEELGDAVWLSQRNLHKQEYEIIRVEEAKKLSRSQPVWPRICRFWDDGISIDMLRLTTQANVSDVQKKVTQGGQHFAQGINQFFVDVLITSSANNKILAPILELDDLLAQASDELSSKGFTPDRFLFPKSLQHRLIQRDLITPDDEIKSNHYVGKTKIGLYAFCSNELPGDTTLVFDSTANIVITKEPYFQISTKNLGTILGGVVYLNPIVKNVQSIVAIENVEQSLARTTKGNSLMMSETDKWLVEVLKIIDSFEQQTPRVFVDDTDIARSLNLPVQVVRDYLDILEKQGKIQSENSMGGHSALLTAEGRITVRDPSYMSQNISPTIINLPAGNFQGAILNINSTLNNVNQVIDSNPHFKQPDKDQLKLLIEQLNQVLQNVPPDKVEEAEAVAETAKALVEAATKDKPNKPLIKINVEGLKQAAQNIASVLPNVLTIATQIISFISKHSPPNV